ncbi:MAG TPA: uracil-DNA glycosylase [Amaricoccus sp.]|uniref:uracil-DNA glycosylase n=1 Tax=Amaricoccus sp. TaxID=1872485 RepID=UPI002CDFD668|nr:uracil-DNA glycosylase [Amaricoccus sp.]HMQ93782.1 uracil-DNA glycosylase [Amaricoccus sp.]HMR53109.1 uracil-DNA glycosylase [Amaricoccus sp.]HMR61005.1 uracil-DNA glycosylase [Amaricoccus sp.]HMU00037.1 uracil-DNA glycosylase [Amaricoccus sp.]
MTPAEPPRDCTLCPRLAEYRRENAAAHPEWFNGAVPSFGDPAARLLVLGLAPGVKGANRTGRPFTGDYAGDLLYATLKAFGFASGSYGADPGDGLALRDCMVTNAVRCVPPQNRPLPAETATCRRFLAARLAGLPHLCAVLCLGRIAHETLLRALGERLAAHPFAHGARHDIGALAIFDSYHCSRYNTNTGRLTAAMFEAVFADLRRHLDAREAVSRASA